MSVKHKRSAKLVKMIYYLEIYPFIKFSHNLLNGKHDQDIALLMILCSTAM